MPTEDILTALAELARALQNQKGRPVVEMQTMASDEVQEARLKLEHLLRGVDLEDLEARLQEVGK